MAAVALAGGMLIGSGADDDGQAPPAGGKAGETIDDAARTRALGLRRQVGQLLVSSFDGTRLPGYLRRRLAAGQTAGVIAFGKNGGSAEVWRRLTHSVQRAARGAALVAVDQEGGAVRSLAFAGPQPGQPVQGDPASVRALARRSAVELRGLGINVNLAPVADVAAGPAAAMAGRAFAGDAATVAGSTRAAVTGLQAGRVAATAKHFPGLGAATVNTDDGPATVGASPALIYERELVPFRAAIAARVPLVMLSHALYPALDTAAIASQSRAIATGLLRERLAFTGVAVTDSLEAQAVLERSGVAEAAVRSVRAGADLLLLTGSASWNEAYPRLLATARRSRAFRTRVAEAAARVLELKRRLGLSSPAP